MTDPSGQRKCERGRWLAYTRHDRGRLIDRTSGTSWHLTLRVVLFALVAATSPLALAAVLIVLTGDRPRLKGVALAIGVIVGQALFFLFVVSVGFASSPDGRDHSTVVDVIT